MKTSIVINEQAKQIILTPENDTDRAILKMITPNDKVDLAFKSGRFTSEHSHAGMNISMCQGGFLRGYSDEESLMMVLTPKERPEPK